MSVDQELRSDSGTDIETIVHGMWNALSNRDWDALQTFLAADCIYLDMPVGPAAAARGCEGIVKRLKIGIAPLASSPYTASRTARSLCGRTTGT